MVLKACTGKNDSAATINMTAKVMTPNVTVSVLRVPALSGIYFFCANKPAMATCPMIGIKRLRISTIPQVTFQKNVLSPSPSNPEPLLAALEVYHTAFHSVRGDELFNQPPSLSTKPGQCTYR